MHVQQDAHPQNAYPQGSHSHSAHSQAPAIPVIAIDGPTASGKGTVAARVAQALGFAYLDSGAIYRALAVAVMQQALDWCDEDQQATLHLATALPLTCMGQHLLLEGQDITQAIRSESAGQLASALAAIPAIRTALLARQRAFRQAPGLVADGRDMGSVVFPDAPLKVFLTASAEVRAQRRYQQLQAQYAANLAAKMGEGNLESPSVRASLSLEQVLQDLQQRDHRDSTRAVAPLAPCANAHILDCTALNVEEAVAQVLAWWHELRA